MSPNSRALPEPLLRIIEARHHDPFAVLGRHPDPAGVVVRAFLPGAARAWLPDIEQPLIRIEGTDLFQWRGAGDGLPQHHRLAWEDSEGPRESLDPYGFAPQLGDMDLHLFAEGRHWHPHHFLGARLHVADGAAGVLFATWAPEAERVSVVGDFNRWDGRRHPMRVRGGGGVWELFIPGLAPGACYKFEIRHRASGAVALKTDPYGRAFELRPATAALVAPAEDYPWGDGAWMEARRRRDWQHSPMAVYEVHLGSWRRAADGGFLGYRQLAHELVEHVAALGFTHIELLPVTEHPLDASWGYQSTGYYAPTARHGTADDFRYFVDHCHRHGIGVILDWVPGHFPRDRHALARFDGSALYEHEDPRRGEHRDWGTLIFNYGRNEVRSFLIGSAFRWVEDFHVDGLRVDAVASMLYLDYSREEGDWLANVHGGRENLEAITFLRELNTVLHGAHPGVLVIAEESTAWPQVSRPVHCGGLGFDMKWNMGWMHDTLAYMHKDPVFRQFHHNALTFGMLYAFSENFVLPFSHDEVVHGKASMLYKMPGDEWQRFANLRLLYTYMYTYPGKKLLFMGTEFAQSGEWDHERSVEWHLLGFRPHQGLRDLVGALNGLHRDEPALHRHDFEPEGFQWLSCNDAAQSVIAYLRRAGERHLAVVLNFTPVPRHGYRLGVPAGGLYRELLNSDSDYFGGSNLGNAGAVSAEPVPWMGQPHSITVTLPPLGALVFAPAP